MHRELLEGARRLIAECECESGCPGCVGPVGDTSPLAKAAALRILDLLIANNPAVGLSTTEKPSITGRADDTEGADDTEAQTA
jgi:ATP-dependent helicase YprA (DUF1998 family)